MDFKERLTLVSIFLRLLLLGCWALRLATVPVFGEQIEKYLLSWMLANDLFVQCDAETWSMRQCEEAIHHFGIAGRSSLDPVFGKVVEVFLDFEVGCGCREVECGGGGDRTAHIVRRDQHVIGFGPGSKLLCFEQATEMGDIRLDNVGGL